MKREIFEKMINKLYPDEKMEVVSYEILEKNMLNENGEWVLDRPAVFVGLRFDNNNQLSLNLTDYFTNFTGYEFSISRV